MNTAIEYEKVILAREFNRLTQKELIQKLRKFDVILSQGELSKIEKGQRKEVSILFLDALAITLGFTSNFFTTPIFKKDIKCGLYRKRKSLKKSEQDYIEATINIFKDIFFNLSKQAKILINNVPFYPINIDTPREIARKTRKYWQVNGAIDNLVDLLENNGILISYIDIDDEKFDGFSCYIDGQQFIFINSRQPGDRLRFTLAHELGHIIMQNDDAPFPKCDEEANEFAAEFLIPTENATVDLQGLTCEKAYYLKSKWKVSMQVLIRKAYDASAITYSRYQSLMVQISKLGYRRNEPNPIPKEETSLFKEIVDVYMSKTGLSDIIQLANILNLNINTLNKFLNPLPNGNLRIV